MDAAVLVSAQTASLRRNKRLLLPYTYHALAPSRERRANALKRPPLPLPYDLLL
jgi:hypothetical protein